MPALSQPGDGDLSAAALKKAARPCGGRVRVRVRVGVRVRVRVRVRVSR